MSSQPPTAITFVPHAASIANKKDQTQDGELNGRIVVPALSDMADDAIFAIMTQLPFSSTIKLSLVCQRYAKIFHARIPVLIEVQFKAVCQKVATVCMSASFSQLCKQLEAARPSALAGQTQENLFNGHYLAAKQDLLEMISGIELEELKKVEGLQFDNFPTLMSLSKMIWNFKALLGFFPKVYQDKMLRNIYANIARFETKQQQMLNQKFSHLMCKVFKMQQLYRQAKIKTPDAPPINPDRLPDDLWQNLCRREAQEAAARVICDFVGHHMEKEKYAELSDLLQQLGEHVCSPVLAFKNSNNSDLNFMEDLIFGDKIVSVFKNHIKNNKSLDHNCCDFFNLVIYDDEVRKQIEKVTSAQKTFSKELISEWFTFCTEKATLFENPEAVDRWILRQANNLIPTCDQFISSTKSPDPAIKQRYLSAALTLISNMKTDDRRKQMMEWFIIDEIVENPLFPTEKTLKSIENLSPFVNDCLLVGCLSVISLGAQHDKCDQVVAMLKGVGGKLFSSPPISALLPETLINSLGRYEKIAQAFHNQLKARRNPLDPYVHDLFNMVLFIYNLNNEIKTLGSDVTLANISKWTQQCLTKASSLKNPLSTDLFLISLSKISFVSDKNCDEKTALAALQASIKLISAISHDEKRKETMLAFVKHLEQPLKAKLADLMEGLDNRAKECFFLFADLESKQ